MTDRVTDLLPRPAAESVRLIAQGYLDAATRALERTTDLADVMALHDFRVAVRRLRTTLRAYRPLFENAGRDKRHKRLHDIADATNRLRDAEVALEWLRPLAAGMTPGERVGLDWLIRRIDQRRVKDQERCLVDTRRSFPKATRQLHKVLGAYRQSVGTEPSTTDSAFAVAVRAAALEEARQLDQMLGEVHHTRDDAAHRARIAAKRLRYVLEPVKRELPGCIHVIERLKALQDLLGELHDLQELEATVRTAVGAAAAERTEQLLDATLTESAPGGRPTRRRGRRAGLVAIAQRIRTRVADLFTQLGKEWLGDKRTWTRDVEGVLPPGAPAPAVVPVPVAAAPPAARRWRVGRPHERR